MSLNALLHTDAAALWEDSEASFAGRTGEQLLSPHRDLVTRITMSSLSSSKQLVTIFRLRNVRRGSLLLVPSTVLVSMFR